MGMSRQSVDRERQDPGHTPSLGSVQVLWGSWAKASLVNSNQKERDFGKFHRGPISGAHKEKPWKVGDRAYHKGSRQVISETCIYLRLCRLLSRACAHGSS